MSAPTLIAVFAALTLFLGGAFSALTLGDPYAPGVDRCLHVAALLAIAASGFVAGRVWP